jgi:hypothetical protein
MYSAFKKFYITVSQSVILPHTLPIIMVFLKFKFQKLALFPFSSMENSLEVKINNFK